MLTRGARSEDVQARVHHALGGRQVPGHWSVRFCRGLGQQVADSRRMGFRACSPKTEPHGSQGWQVRLQRLQELWVR